MTDPNAPHGSPGPQAEAHRLSIHADGVEVSLEDLRLSVTAEGRTTLDVSLRELRRVQFDIERGRPATLVIVPERPFHEPQVIAVPPDQFGALGEVLEYVGRNLDRGARTGS